MLRTEIKNSIVHSFGGTIVIMELQRMNEALEKKSLKEIKKRLALSKTGIILSHDILDNSLGID